MANYDILKESIAAVIKENGNQEITGNLLQQTLLAIVNTLGSGYQFAGVADAAVIPGTPDAKLFYVAKGPGTYLNFNNLVVNPGEIAVFFQPEGYSAWYKQTVNVVDIVNNLSDTATDKALSAAMGKQIGDSISQLGQDVNGIHYSGSATYTGAQEKKLLDNIYIPAGTIFSMKVSSPNAVWTRVGVAANDTWGAGTTLRELVQNGVVYEITAPVDITSIYVYLITATSYGDLTIEIDSDGIKDNVEEISENLEHLTKIVYGKNLLDLSTLFPQKRIEANGNYGYVTNDYAATDYIPVVPGQSYYLSNKNGAALCNRSDAYIAFYDTSKTCIGSSASYHANVNQVTVPNGAVFMRVSLTMARVTGMEAQIEIGTERTTYVDYVPPKEAIDPNLIVLPDDSVNTDNIVNKSITRQKIADNVSLPAGPIRFGSFRVHQDGLTRGRSLELSARFNISKNTRIIATIDGVVDTIQVGVGYLSGMWVELTQTQVKTRYNASQTVQTFNHGLTLGTHTTVIIEKTVTKEKQDEGLIKVIDDYGNVFSQIVTWWGSSVGTPFVRNGNSSENIDSSLSVMLADITKKIWMFGDSYLGFDTPQSWMYYPITWGYDSFLLNAKGIIDARESYNNFLSILSMGESIPSYAVWCLGMNGGYDTNGAVNPSWLAATRKFLSTCAERGIEPILATIPSVPTDIHTKLNEWVRTSGYRYIDFADAVESGSDYFWRGWGTSDALLSSDKVHPTTQGAVELACRALQDFPEITVL